MKSDAEIFILRSHRRLASTWIRFHSRVDKPGLFLRYVEKLNRVGLGIRHASIVTELSIGAYDWFEVREGPTRRLDVGRLRNLLFEDVQSPRIRPVKFDEIEIEEATAEEWIIQFRGREQPGGLLAAAAALFQLGLSVRWAKIHSWGRQMSGVFGVTPPNAEVSQTKKQEYFTQLKKRLHAIASDATKSSGESVNFVT